MWVITIWSFIALILVAAFTSETYAPVLLARKAKRSQQESGTSAGIEKQANHSSLLSKLLDNVKKIPLLLFYEPMLTILCVWTGLLLSIIYSFFEIFRESKSYVQLEIHD